MSIQGGRLRVGVRGQVLLAALLVAAVPPGKTGAGPPAVNAEPSTPRVATQGDQLDAKGQPRIHVDTSLVDLGKVPEGEIGEVIFAVVNRGEAPLEILKATTSCTCIRFDVPKRVLAPGERMFIMARYITTGHQGKESGAITLTTNDPVAPRMQLVISVDIESVYEMEPLGVLRLQPQRPGLPCEPELKLLPATAGPPLKVLGVQMQAKRFEVRRSPYERDGRVGEKLTLVGLGQARRGALSDAIILAFQVGEQKKRVRVPVHLPLLGELRYEPRVMAVVNPAWRGRQLGRITVESVLGKPVEILQATARGPIEVTARATEPQRKYEVAVRVADDAPAGPIGALVTIVTDSPGETIIQVPVFGNVHPWIWVLPEAVLLKVGGGSSQAALAEVRLRWPVAAPVKLGRPQCDDPRLTAEVVPGEDEVQDGMELATATLRIISATDFEPADFQTTVRLATGWENCPSVEVPVFVRTD